MAVKVAKLTVSVPRDLIALTDEIANERNISRSKVVSMSLREFAHRRLRQQMVEGYRAMAAENLQFARGAMEIAHEAFPEWK